MRISGLLLLLFLAAVPARFLCAQAVAPPSSAPLPPLRELLLDLDRNEKSVEAKGRDYTYHVHFEGQEFDGKGGVKKTSNSDAESFTIDGVRVNRVVAKDGKPLSPEDTKKENERIDKDVQKARDRREKHADKGEDTNGRGDPVIPVSRILELGTFTNERREVLAGRPTIVMDYAGNKDVKTHGPAEGIIRDLVGTVWVDEADRVLVQGRGRFLSDFKIAGGLVMNIHKGFSFEFQASKVNADAWLPASFSGQGSARVLLFRGVNGSLRATMSNYRKFRTEVKVNPASHVLDENGNPIPDSSQPSTDQSPGEQPH